MSALYPGQSSTERFNLHEWICTPPNDMITVCADYESSITESLKTITAEQRYGLARVALSKYNHHQEVILSLMSLKQY